MQIPCLNKLLRRDSAGLMWDRGASNMMQTKKKTHRQNCIYDRANKSLLYYYHLCKWWNFNIPNLQSPEVVVAHSRKVWKAAIISTLPFKPKELVVPCWFLTKHCEGNSKYNVESNTTSCMFQCIGIGVQRIFLLNCRFSLPHLVNGRKFMLTAFTLRPKSWRMWRCMSMWCKHKHISNNIIEWCWWIIILLLLNQRLLRNALQSSRKYCMYIYIPYHFISIFKKYMLYQRISKDNFRLY